MTLLNSLGRLPAFPLGTCRTRSSYSPGCAAIRDLLNLLHCDSEIWSLDRICSNFTHPVTACSSSRYMSRRAFRLASTGPAGCSSSYILLLRVISRSSLPASFRRTSNISFSKSRRISSIWHRSWGTSSCSVWVRTSLAMTTPTPDRYAYILSGPIYS